MSVILDWVKNRPFIIAEIGINHNGSAEMAHKMIDFAALAGVHAVKFQKRTPELSLPREKWDIERDTPWDQRMTYINYRRKIELGVDTYAALADHAHRLDIKIGASAWDLKAVDDLTSLPMDFIKVPSALIVDIPLVEKIARSRLPLMASTGMSNCDEVIKLVDTIKRHRDEFGLFACTSAYPASVDSLNLQRIQTLKEMFPTAIVGWSGHEVGLWTSLMAVVVGARIIERHFTLDRSLPGTDHAASLEPNGFRLLVRESANWIKASGKGELRLLDCEMKDRERLRK